MLVAEDSILGLKAARAAGCKPVLIPDLQPMRKEWEPIVYTVCDSLADLIPLIESFAGAEPRP